MTRAATLLLISLLAAPVASQAPRDRRIRPSGSASIAGIIVSDEREPRPLRRAHVTLNGPSMPGPEMIISGDDGSFQFLGLPGGKYTVSAAKNAWVSMNYGARGPLRPGTTLTLVEGETKKITIALLRGAVITGVLTDAEGQPVPGLAVTAFRYRYSPSTGGLRLLPIGTASTTDENGVYRVFGLAPGEYVIGTQIRQFNAVLAMVTPADVRQALAEARSTAVNERRIPSTLTPRNPFVSKTTVMMAPTYYPGTAVANQAALVSVGAGDERAGIDFQIAPIPAATVSGSLPLTTPRPVINLTRRDDPVSERVQGATLDPFGRFTFSGVVPGRYTVSAIVRPARTPDGAAEGQWATTDITIDGQDVSVALMLQPAFTISGRAVFEGSAPPLSSMRLPLPITSTTIGTGSPQVQVEPDGRFTISGLVAGPYRLAAMPGIRTRIGSWWLKSIVIGGRELLDGPIDLQKEASDAVVTFSNRASELSGVVRSPTPGEHPSAFVIVFTTDRSAWFHNSRRVAGVRPDAEGRYAISNLPPGDYFAVVDDNVDPNEWFDPAVLDRLVPRAVRITLGANDTRSQDFVIK